MVSELEQILRNRIGKIVFHLFQWAGIDFLIDLDAESKAIIIFNNSNNLIEKKFSLRKSVLLYHLLGIPLALVVQLIEMGVIVSR